MTDLESKITRIVWKLSPAPLERKLRTEAGLRFMRFVLVAIAAVVTSQIALVIFTGPLKWTGFLSGFVASMIAAAVSYILSRWAWERKGKPDWLRETLPFWGVSVAVWIVLGLTTHFASVWANSMDLHHLKRHLVINGAYFVMNCITFVCRFLIFHYVLFKNRGEGAKVPVEPGFLGPVESGADSPAEPGLASTGQSDRMAAPGSQG
jgi:putative flippase GtrA